MATSWPAIRAGIFHGESGGDYNTLYSHVERNGPFAGTKLTDMTVNQALAFNSPNGPYGQWARSHGIAAAPLGAYQVIHSTLQAAKQGMGLSGNERMTPDLQEKIGQHIYAQQGTGAWAGYKGPRTPAEPNYGPTSDAMSRPSGSSWSPAPDPGTTAGILGGQSGGILGGIPQDAANEIAATLGGPEQGQQSPLQKLFAGLADTKGAPAPQFGQFGDARSSGDALLKYVKSLKGGRS